MLSKHYIITHHELYNTYTEWPSHPLNERSNWGKNLWCFHLDGFCFLFPHASL